MSRHSIERDRPDIALRPFRAADVEDVYRAAIESRRELAPWMPWCHPDYSVHEARSWLLTQVAAFESETEFEFAVLSSNDRFLGGCGLNAIDHENRRANLGYWVRTHATGRGVATAAVRLLVAWAFAHTEFERLEILAAVGNVASQRVAEKAGALREGTLRRRLHLHGKNHDAVLYSFVR